jgi:protein-tyrosine phosphatase
VTAAPIRVCFVCTGNICRSPTAEVVLRAQLAEAGLAEQVIIDSAGTGPWHAGKDMDPRARRVLARHGYQPEIHVAKQFQPRDFSERDLVIALDSGHLSRLGALARLADDPAGAAASIRLLRSFDPAAAGNRTGDLDVPDPYYDAEPEFEHALAQIEAACAGLVQALRPLLAAA